MSTLSVTNLKHESATGNNIVLASDGTATFAEVISASKGIAFPATQVSSANANTLDDYEEGTFTPTINRFSTNPSVTYTAQYGYYRKIGTLVFVVVDVNASSISGGSGNCYIGGIPFNPPSLSNNFPVPNFRDATALTCSANNIISGYVHPTDPRVYLTQDNITTNSSSAVSSWDASGRVTFSLTYITS